MQYIYVIQWMWPAIDSLRAFSVPRKERLSLRWVFICGRRFGVDVGR